MALNWIPLYKPLKVLGMIYLWHPQTEGATPIYQRTLRPVLVKHQRHVDRVVKQGKDWVDVHLGGHVRRIQKTVMGAVESGFQQQQQQPQERGVRGRSGGGMSARKFNS